MWVLNDDDDHHYDSHERQLSDGRMTTSMPAPLSIAIIRSTSLGDVILATAVLDFLVKLPMPIAITWYGRAPTLELLSTSYPQLKTATLGSWSVAYRQLSQHDVVIDLQQSLKTRIICWSLRLTSSTVVRFSDKLYSLRYQLLNSAKSRPRTEPLPELALAPSRRQYEVAVATCYDAVLNMVSTKGGAQLVSEEFRQAADVAKAEARPRLYVPEDLGHKVEAKISQAYPHFRTKSRHELPLVAVAPGASYGTKRAPVETFAGILTAAYAEQPFAILMLGDKNDKTVCAELTQRLNIGPCYDMSGELSFTESIASLSLCQVILGNDSVLPHGSEALGTPSFSLFGPTVEGFGFAPFLSSSQALSVDIGCRPCSKHGQAPCRHGDLACFRRLPVEDIGVQLARRLASST